ARQGMPAITNRSHFPRWRTVTPRKPLLREFTGKPTTKSKSLIPLPNLHLYAMPHAAVQVFLDLFPHSRRQTLDGGFHVLVLALLGACVTGCLRYSDRKGAAD